MRMAAKLQQAPPPNALIASMIPSNRNRRTRTEIDQIKRAAYEVAEQQRPLSVRGMFYQLVGRGVIAKDEREYKSLSRYLGQMREAGELPWAWIVDYSRRSIRPRMFNDLSEAYWSMQQHYRIDLWSTQSTLCEVWIEKLAMLGVFESVTNPLGVNLFPLVGFPSKSVLHAAAAEIAANDRPTTIFYFGDHDPSGKNIPIVVLRTLRQYLDRYFEGRAELVQLKRLAVNEEQIEQYSLPTRPTKRTDSRSKNFAGESVELDAMPPAELRRLATEAVEGLIDQRDLAIVKKTEAAHLETLEEFEDQLLNAADARVRRDVHGE